MGRIHLLDQNTINQIAAGEVVDRPVSVVKELIENAIDAGATAITVEIKQGGTTLVRVTDNGSGIAADDLQTAFKRHSTSKIKEAVDLLTVSSLGFRGEALSSIAAVARVELITRTRTSLVGNRYVIEGGEELVCEEAGAPEGTTMIVRDLFFNTPARRKFLKSPATEGGYIHDMLGKIALSRPDISFRFIQNGQNKLHTSGNNNLKDVIYHVYGRDFTRELLPISYKCSFFRIEGFIGKPLLTRSTRSYEVYFINGRYIKSTLIHKAIEEGYRNFLMQHKFPVTVFNIIIDPEFTDVNVHPSKMELRFRNQEFLYEEIVNAVRKTLTTRELAPGFTVETAEKKEKITEEKKVGRMGNAAKAGESSLSVKKENRAVQPVNTEQPGAEVQPVSAEQSKAAAQSISTGQLGAAAQSVSIEHSKKAFQPANTEPVKAESHLQGTEAVKEADAGHKSVKTVPQPNGTEKKNIKAPEPFETKRMERLLREEKTAYEAKKTFPKEPDELKAVDVKQQNMFEEKLLTAETISEIQLAGQIFDTYWIVQYKDTFMIIDQHAAHEKVLYESILKQLKERKYNMQQMNPPAIITLSPRQQSQLKALSGFLKEMGYEIEHFGGNEYAVYGVPDNLVGVTPMDFLDEVLETAGEKGIVTPEAIYEKTASLACKAAIKGNQHLSEIEAAQLIAQLVELENPYTCPHGRPTMIKMTKYELEKKFKRVL